MKIESYLSLARQGLAVRIRFARGVLASNMSVTDKYWMAGEIRSDVRRFRDNGWISFECCEALQRILDY